ncbi:hypothetical protein J2P12_04375, partial [Candidatus Bathyarchaeota archaeon]|nr:hypothetical protein [Candidatus Bathyarchaeota archaeon]
MENRQSSSQCGTSGNPAPYENSHNGFVWFQDIFNNSTRCSKIVLANPTSCGSVTDCTLLNDLASGSAPNFMWLIPNDCNNMHADPVCTLSNGYNGCTVAGFDCIRDGDSYLRSLVPNILNSTTFKTTRSALFIVFDEGKKYCPLTQSEKEDCIYAVWAGRGVRNNFHTGTLYTQYSLTKTIETNWNLAPLTVNDTNATPMSEFFKSDFNLAANPASLTVLKGATSNSTLSLSSVNGTGTVTLSANSIPSSLSTTINPTTVTVPIGGTATSILSVTSNIATNYTITVTATSPLLSRNLTISVIVQDFQITPNPTILKPNRGTSATSTVTISPVNHFTGTATLIATGTTGLNTSITPSTINLGSGTATLTVVSTLAGNYTGAVTATSGTLTHQIMINVQVIDFTVGASQPFPVKVGATASSNVTITPLNHFTGTVSLSDSVPTGLSCAPITPSMILPTGTATIACTSAKTGNYPLTITATNGTLSHQTTATFRFQDYAISANNGQITSPVGTNTTTTITVASINSYSGNVTLAAFQTCTNCGSSSQGGGVREPLRLVGPAPQLSFSFNPSAVVLDGSSGQADLTVTIPLGLPSGSYMINVTAFDGTNAHSVLISLTVTDFSITTPTSLLTISPGQNTTQTITLNSINGFQGNITLSTTVSPTGPSANMNPSLISIGTNAKTSTLTIIVPSNTQLGNYTITIQASTGTLFHAVTITITIRSGSTDIFVKAFSEYPALPLGVYLMISLILTLAVYHKSRDKLARPKQQERMSRQYSHPDLKPLHHRLLGIAPMLVPIDPAQSTTRQ